MTFKCILDLEVCHIKVHCYEVLYNILQRDKNMLPAIYQKRIPTVYVWREVAEVPVGGFYVDSVQCTVKSLYHTIYSVRRTLYSVQCRYCELLESYFEFNLTIT